MIDHRQKHNKASSSQNHTSRFFSNRLFQIGFSLVILVGIVIFLVFGHIRTRVRNVNWYGYHYLNIQLVETHLRPYFQNQTSLWRLPIRPIIQELLRYPVVEKVAVRKRLPDALDIYISERIPFAIIRDPEGFKIIDIQGVYFGRVQGQFDTTLQPIIRLDTPLPARWHDVWKVRPIIERLRNQDTWLLSKVIWLHLRGDFIYLILDQPNIAIIMADKNDLLNPTDWNRKVHQRLGFLSRHWDNILQKITTETREIDLRFRNQIIIR